VPADGAPRERTVLFYRDFRKFHGGHLKVFDYFNHVRHAPGFTPVIGFSKRTVWDDVNPWRGVPELVTEDYDAVDADVFFVAGRDWHRMDSHPAAGLDFPVINLVQSVRHADPEGTRFEFLGRPAIRVCVSEVIAEAVRETGLVREPVLAIPNAIDVQGLEPGDPSEDDLDVLILGLKQPERAVELEALLRREGREVVVFTDFRPRSEFEDRLRRAKVTVFLPLPTEGFYLPPLEGMAMRTLVVCPEHEGEHSIYRNGENCFRPAYENDAIVDAVEAALALSPEEQESMRSAARETAEEHSLDAERAAFQEVLDRLDELWEEARA
jgi:hypothetical protein